MTAARIVPSTAEVKRELEAVLARDGMPRRVVAVDRKPSCYATSSRMEQVSVSLEDGAQLNLLLKHLSRGALSDVARRVKPRFLQDPLREIETYRTLLAPNGIGASFYGAGADQRRQRYWLLLERVDGLELYQVGELERWQSVARWLARLHEQFRSEVDSSRTPARLLRYEPSFYRLWLDRALRFASGAPRTRILLDHIARHHDRIVERLTASPPTIIHGEFYASNVLISGDGGARVVPVDWETTGIGPALIDLAALTAGWGDDARGRLRDAYREELVTLERDQGRESFAEELACCRLHVAIQWLGWSRSWSPPPGHRQDWLGEATRAVEELGL